MLAIVAYGQPIARAGIELALLVDPGQRSVTLVEPGGQLEVFSSPRTVALLPGLVLALDDVFSVLDA